MKTITIITPANIEVEYRLAGAGSRLAAFIIDFILQTLGILFMAFMVWGFDYHVLRGTQIRSGSISFILVGAFVIHFGYFIVCELLMNGQTLGKKVFGLRAIRENGRPLEFTQSLIRGLVRSSADIIYVGLVSILFHPQHKRLGDMAAGTVVVSENYNNLYQPSVTVDTWPSFFPDSADLNAAERKLAEEWLRRRDSMNEHGESLGHQMAHQFKLSIEKRKLNESISN